MPTLLLFNKPWGVLSQFTDAENRPVLADYISMPGIYPAGRLDRDSEGLLLLTDSGSLAHQLTHPKKNTWKTYLVQVEGIPDTAALQAFRNGLELKDGKTHAAKICLIDDPVFWPRNPPVRFRASIPTQWLEIQIQEGRNRQVRRMTAAIGHPTLRLVRTRIGSWSIDNIQPGSWRVEKVDTPPQAAHRHKQRWNKTTAIRKHRK